MSRQIKGKKMAHSTIIVRAEWDAEASVWVATSEDIQGLVAESPTLEELKSKVLVMIPELMELNGLISDLPEIPVQIMAAELTRVSNPNYH